jgi:hypothetical protein
MHIQKLLSIGLVALLLLSLVMLTAPVSAEPAPAGEGILWVVPDFVDGSAVGLGNTFIVELWANISTTAGVTGQEGCFAYAYWFGWNDTLLEIQSYNVYPPADIWTVGIFPVEDLLKDLDANTKNDTHSYSVTALGLPPGWKDGRKIAEYNFTVADDPGLDVESLLEITNKGFADAEEEAITMTPNSGTYWIPEFPAALIIPLFIIATLATAILGKKAWSRKRSSSFVVKVEHNHQNS